MAKRKDALESCTGFEWNESNALKNWERHRVAQEEAEDVFFNEPLIIRSDVRNSAREKRYYALGRTDEGRYLFIAFRIRNTLVRVISARDMNREKGVPMRTTKKKPVPNLRSEDEEREFWGTHDSTEFIDWGTAGRHKFPELKPTLRTISIRLPVSMIEDLKSLANKRDVPYQSLLKIFLAEKVREERRRAS